MNFLIERRLAAVFWLCFIAAAVADQLVKAAILSGFRWESEAIAIILTFNDGVAFSWFASLGKWLKYIQIALIAGAIFYVFSAKLLGRYGAAFGVLLGAGASNLLDRFIHGGVVDYVFWRYGFEFAVFNLADVLIDCSIVYVIWAHLKERKKAARG
jgi:signal peptidase II